MVFRLFIADTVTSRLDGLCEAVETAPDLQLVGRATSGDDALRQIVAQRPDVLLATTQLQQPSSFELARYVKFKLPDLAVVLIADRQDDDELYEAAKFAVAAYVERTLSAEELLSIARRAAEGESLVDDAVLANPRVAARVLRDFRELQAGANGLQPLLTPLSAREMEILDLMARGKSNKEIARALNISDQTVKNHVSSILRKLAVNDRTQAVVLALREGWIKIERAGV